MALYVYEANIATSGEGPIFAIHERSMGELDAITLLDIGQIVPEALVIEEALYQYDPQYDVFSIRLLVDKKIPKDIEWRQAGIANFVAKTLGREVADMDLSITKSK